ncbi:MAG TPA: YHS domain-containing (seleno)protein [Chryseosolibacter sp.]|nr:YHS domain-containing (seleno)protein [Chryseosolibacter sp.]
MKVLIVLLVCVPTALIAQLENVRRKHFNIKNDIALQGYDPVSYFAGKPVEGDETFKFTHKGVTYLFSGLTTLNKFKANPEKYEPAYGGWCAYAMGENGEKVKIDPETFKIIDGTLYLFYNFWGNNTLEDWNSNEKKLKQAADKNWSAMFN